MKAEGKTIPAVLFIHLAGFLFLASAFAINPLKITRAFFSDEAVYYTMTYSFAFDGDMEFRRSDLVRVYQEFAAGPQGIILKLNHRDENIVFGKSYLYALVSSPFVRVLGTNGFFAFHALLLWLNLLCGYRFCISFMQPRAAVLFSFFYFLANASLLYLFWMTPEYFTMSLVCYAFFFFLAAERLQSKWKLFNSPFNYLIAAFLFGLASYSKPTNALLVVPLGIWMLYRKKILPALFTLSVFVLTAVALFGINVYFTGEWNYQGGDRAVFYDHFPFEKPGISEFAPFKQKESIGSMHAPPFYGKAFLYNWIYFFFGRFSGLAIYFFPMFFGLMYFLFSKKGKLSVPVYIAGSIGILTYMIGLPWNYFGGSGTIGNRYLLNAFPVLLFAIAEQPSRRLLAASIALSLVFPSAFLFSPVFSSFDVAFHQKRSLLHVLPAEKTLLVDLPTNNSLRARRVFFDKPANYFAYFLDDNTYYGEDFEQYSGFWVKGERTAELILRAIQPVTRMKVRARSMAPLNEVTLTVNGRASQIRLSDSVFHEMEVSMPGPFPYDRDGTGTSYLYDIKINSSSGKIATVDSAGERYLGVFIRLELPEAQQANPQADETSR